MAETTSMSFSMGGIAVGAVALLLVLVHFYAGPFAPQKPIERTVAETAVAIRDATVAALRGEDVEDEVSQRDFDIDRALAIFAAVLGGLAIILGVVGFAKGEPARAAGGAAVLGAGAIAFQFAIVAIGAIVLAILVAAVIGQLGLDF